MDEKKIASHEEVARSLRLLSLIVRQHLEEEAAGSSDPYDHYVQQLVLQLFRHFDDLPSALLEGFDTFN